MSNEGNPAVPRLDNPLKVNADPVAALAPVEVVEFDIFASFILLIYLISRLESIGFNCHISRLNFLEVRLELGS